MLPSETVIYHPGASIVSAFQFATLVEDDLIRGDLSDAALNACDLEELRSIFFNPLFVDVDSTFSREELMRSASRGEPGPAKLCVDPHNVAILKRYCTPGQIEPLMNSVRVDGNEVGRFRAWIRHARAVCGIWKPLSDIMPDMKASLQSRTPRAVRTWYPICNYSSALVTRPIFPYWTSTGRQMPGSLRNEGTISVLLLWHKRESLMTPSTGINTREDVERFVVFSAQQTTATGRSFS